MHRNKADQPARAALIHARLAVVDIENGLQPMQLDWQGESYTLVYNGELYNTPELRAAPSFDLSHHAPTPCR